MPTLNWIGKEKVISHHQDVPYRVLEHIYGFTADPKAGKSKESKEPTGSGNKIIHGDNLEALKSLLPEYEGKIKCIYIDPPYNTGNEAWVYNDNVNHPKIKKWLGEVVGKDSEDLTRHDKWLCMMYPRLKLLHKLLANDGAIFISIDDNEQANLKLICEEIFGARNHIASIAVINNFKGRSDDKYIATAHENLIIYQKGSFETQGVSLPEKYSKDYKLTDENGRYRHLGLRKRGSNARKIDRPNLFYPIYYSEKCQSLSLKKSDDVIEILPKLSNGENGTWRWGKETLSKRLGELEIKYIKKRGEYDVFQKDYLVKNEIEKRIKPKSFWYGSDFSAEAGTLELKKIFNKKVFETPKSSHFLYYVIQQATDKDSIVLDSFSGSGTTAHAVLNLNKQDGGNRKFILIEMEDYANDITAERVKRVAKGYKFKGKEKQTLKSFPTNITQLKKADKIVELVEEYKKNGSYTSVKVESQDGKIAIVGEKQINGKTEGIGGAFDYYELGLPLFDENHNLNEQLGIEKIREYIWFSETRTAFTEPDTSSYLLGTKDQTAYYFIYEKEALTTLDYDALYLIKNKSEQYIIYADNCLLSQDFLHKHNIIFKKIPRDITRF